MARSIIQLLTDNKKAEKMGRSGQASVYSHFTIDNMASLHSSAFSKIVTKKDA
jgi:hypothetical protein